MMMGIRLNIYQKALSVYLGILIVFWFLLFRSGETESFWNFFYSFAFSLIPLIGGLIGIFFAKPWGWLKSSMGRAIFFISLGLFSWGAGSMVWSYYNFFGGLADPSVADTLFSLGAINFAGIYAPYPSVADIGFVLAILLWVIGIINLSRATGARKGLKEKNKWWLVSSTVAATVAFSYYLLVNVARGGEIFTQYDETLSLLMNRLKLVLDFIYPLGDLLILVVTLIVFSLSFKYLGGFYKSAVRILFGGFILMYFADMAFSFTTTVETFYVGNWGDLLFTIALFVITLGTLGLRPIKEPSK